MTSTGSSAATPLEVNSLRAESVESAEAYRRGKIIVVRKGATLPAFCVRCGAPGDAPPVLRKFTWHHPGYYFVLFLGVLPYFLAAYFVQAQGKIYLTACNRHRNLRFMAHLVGSIGVVTGTVMAIAGYHYDMSGFFMGGMILVVIFALSSLIVGRSLVPTCIDDHYVYLEGAGDEFLNHLPNRADQQ